MLSIFFYVRYLDLGYSFQTAISNRFHKYKDKDESKRRKTSRIVLNALLSLESPSIVPVVSC